MTLWLESEQSSSRASLCIFTTGASLASYVPPCQGLVYTASNRSCNFWIKKHLHAIGQRAEQIFSYEAVGAMGERLTFCSKSFIWVRTGGIQNARVCENALPENLVRNNVKFTDVTSAYVINGIFFPSPSQIFFTSILFHLTWGQLLHSAQVTW